MVGLSESFKLLARREGPTESGYSYAMEKDKGKLDWTGGGEALLKERKTARWENLPLWNKVRAFLLETLPLDEYSRRTAVELLTLTSLFYLNHIWEETQKQSSGPGLWYMVLLWEKAIRRLEREVMSSTPRDAVLCSTAIVTVKDD